MLIFSALKEEAKRRRILMPILRLLLSEGIQSVMMEVSTSIVRGTSWVVT